MHTQHNTWCATKLALPLNSNAFALVVRYARFTCRQQEVVKYYAMKEYYKTNTPSSGNPFDEPDDDDDSGDLLVNGQAIPLDETESDLFQRDSSDTRR